MNICNKEIEYLCEGVNHHGYVAWDDDIKGPRPGVMVIHEWWGLNDYPKQRARQLAELGYVGLAIDMYGNGNLANTPDQAAELMNAVFADMKLATLKLQTSLETLLNLDQVDPDKTAAIGYCFGGAMVLHMARVGLPLNAVASFHGSLGAFHEPSANSIIPSILVCHGEDDAMVTLDDVKGFKKEMESVNATYEVIVHAGAEHGFSSKEADENHNKFGLPVGYNQKADEDSWAALQKLLTSQF